MTLRPLVLPLIVLLIACGDDDSRGSSSSPSLPTNVSGIASVPGDTGSTMADPTEATGTAPVTSGTTEGGEQGDTSGDSSEGMLPKFDFGVEPDVMEGPPDTGCTKVDLLFVIDSSGSMQDEQVTLVQSFPDFVSEMQTELADAESYHVGVTTSDNYPYNEINCIISEGALVTQTGGLGSSGQVCGPFSSGKRWMDEMEPNLAQKFQCAAQVGIQGDGNERPMQTMQAAVSPALNAPGACNDGFIRQDALLVVVIITDEEDDHEVAACGLDPQTGSAGEPASWFNGLVAAKGGVESNIVVLSLVGPVAPPCPALDKCNGGIAGAETASRIVQFTEMFTYGSVGQICAASYKQFFHDAIADIAGACDGFTPPG
jgi:hypothetical protein